MLNTCTANSFFVCKEIAQFLDGKALNFLTFSLKPLWVLFKKGSLDVLYIFPVNHHLSCLWATTCVSNYIWTMLTWCMSDYNTLNNKGIMHVHIPLMICIDDVINTIQWFSLHVNVHQSLDTSVPAIAMLSSGVVLMSSYLYYFIVIVTYKVAVQNVCTSPLIYSND